MGELMQEMITVSSRHGITCHASVWLFCLGCMAPAQGWHAPDWTMYRSFTRSLLKPLNLQAALYALISLLTLCCNMQLNVLDDLAEAMKALDGKKKFCFGLLCFVLFVWVCFRFLLSFFGLWWLRDRLDYVQVLYQITIEAPQSAGGHVCVN